LWGRQRERERGAFLEGAKKRRERESFGLLKRGEGPYFRGRPLPLYKEGLAHHLKDMREEEEGGVERTKRQCHHQERRSQRGGSVSQAPFVQVYSAKGVGSSLVEEGIIMIRSGRLFPSLRSRACRSS